ncbi:hypothetical protein JCM19294_592 [Nonlabens tegetincola]|uniref:Uncharacterized protein n=1 Tax=Nonlabens tegetincola TaxID=323273 RepID=A0A090QNL6_9FLAO|nr:hypothetical protein JCM19294_592 [Nonlabens tegetincola]
MVLFDASDFVALELTFFGAEQATTPKTKKIERILVLIFM